MAFVSRSKIFNTIRYLFSLYVFVYITNNESNIFGCQSNVGLISNPIAQIR